MHRSAAALFSSSSRSRRPEGARRRARDTLGGLGELVKNVAFRDLDAGCRASPASAARVWAPLTGQSPPARTAPFPPVRRREAHSASPHPGDILFHIRSDRRDLVLRARTAAARPARRRGRRRWTRPSGFRYFDVRDLLGFVDGTANPVGAALPEATLVGDEDAGTRGRQLRRRAEVHAPAATRGSALTTEQQEAIIGRTKADNIELDDATTGQKSHKTLSTIVVGRAGARHPPRQHAVREPRRRRVRHLLHRLRASPVGDREDAGAHVRRRPARRCTTGCWTSRCRVTGATFFAPSRHSARIL